MSQAGIVNVEGSHPQIPTSFVTDSGTAIPIANVLEILGTTVAAHSIPLMTTGSENTVTVQAQYAAAAASSVATNAGVASFDSADFTVDANGFVSFSGSGESETLTGNSGGAVSPTANNINTVGTGSITVVGNPGTSTLTTQLTGLTNHNVLVGAGTATITNVPPSTAGFVLTSNGAAADPSFQSVSASGAITTITGNSGGAESPTAGGNFNILGTGSITVAGSANTETVQLTGLTNHAIQIGAGTATLTQLGAGTTGQVLQTNTGADPTWSTATYPSTTTINQILYSSSANVVGGITAGNNGVLISGTTGIPSWLADGTTGQVLTATTGSPPSWASPATSGTVTSVSVVTANGFAGTVATATTTPAITLTTTITGVLSGNGTAISGSAITQHDVLVGGASNAITSISPSTAGLVLTSNGVSADPSFQSVSASGAIITITGNSGGAESPTAGGNFNILGTGSITVAGSANTETVQLTGLTNHNVLVGAGTATITNVAPSATSGVPLISQGSAADPSFGTAVVAGGGTGATSFTAYAPICGGTTSTGALQSASTGLSTSGFVLTSNGASALPSFQSPAVASFSVVIQTFTSSGTYTPTSGMAYCTIEVIGGGGGGGAKTSAAGNGSAGGGGGAGGYARRTVSKATVGVSQTVTVGAAGSAGSAGPNNGGAGGNTSVGSLVSATGGNGGNGSISAPATGVSWVDGGVGSNGDVNTQGSGGGPGYGATTMGFWVGGNGGSVFFGGGQPQSVTGATGVDGMNAASYGAGGTGGATIASTQRMGGSGAAGLVIITEYIT